MRDFYAQWQMARKQSAAEGEYLAPFLNRDQETYAFLSGEYSQSQFVTILSLFQDMPTEILLNYICSHDTKCSYSTNQIPQFSDFEKGAVIVPRVLEFFPDGINFTELGRKLVDAKEKEANRKYGENHASLASLMSLASISKMERKLVYPTSLGHFLIDYQINEKDRLLKAMLLRNPFIQEMVRIAFHGGNYGCLLTELASSTARRRRQSVRHLMEFIFQDTECKEQYARIDWTV